MIDEGYIKYRCDWIPGPPPAPVEIAALDACRRELFRLGLLGHDAGHAVDFGNVSVRAIEPSQFIITGTQTGHVAESGPEHYARVTAWDIAGNRVSCTGQVRASSESLTHAALYEMHAGIGAVVHVHQSAAWQALRDTLPTTDANASYGTPAMAAEFQRLFGQPALHCGFAVMGGHPDGLISFGRQLDEAMKLLRECVLPVCGTAADSP